MKIADKQGEGTFIVPAGEYIESIVIEERGGNDVIGGIRFGLSHGEDNIVGCINVDANTLTPRVTLTIPPFSMSNPTTVYFDAVNNWNGALIDIYVVLKVLE